jgi:hypothetical protein
MRVLKSLCGILDLEKKGNREEVAERIVTFLLEPKDSGKPVPPPRPKRSSAVKANSKGYSEYVSTYCTVKEGCEVLVKVVTYWQNAILRFL